MKARAKVLAGALRRCRSDRVAQQPAAPRPPARPANLTEKAVRRGGQLRRVPRHDRAPGAGLERAGPRADLILDRLDVKGFKEGTRQATIIHQIAKGYSDAEIAAIADYFSKQPR